MIIQNFDNGWGSQYHWKRKEIQIVNQLIGKWIYDQSETVIINSVWYDSDFHQQVMSWLRTHTWDRIVLVAMLDPAIPQPDWYNEFGRPVITVGAYPGPYQIDLFAQLLIDSIDLNAYGDLTDASDIEIPFLCLNRKPHWHRKKFFAELQQHDLLYRGIISMGSEKGPAVLALPEDDYKHDMAPNSSNEHHGIPNDIASLGPPAIWRRCFFNVVTETIWNINQNCFVSEKIYKPIVGMRPFVVYDPDGGGKWLRDRGFITYETDFRDVSDYNPDDPTQLVLFLQDISKQSSQYFQYKFKQLIDKIKHNRLQFDVYVEQQQQKIHNGIN